VNDGAKAAQAGALFFALVGLYLLATAFSASDEDLLLLRTVTISQIGAALPVSFSFAIAPFVFLFLHIYTLVRYDMLAANIRQFQVELQGTVPLEVDRERCRQLLANVEFIQATVAPRCSRLYSRLWRCLVWALIAIFPIVILLLVQINALRYQSMLISSVQRLWLFVDLSVLVWFFDRNSLGEPTLPLRGVSTKVRWAKLLWLPATVIDLNFLHLNVVPAGADTQEVHYGVATPAAQSYPDLIPYLTRALLHPFDTVICTQLSWGCRYLRVDHRPLTDGRAIGDINNASGDRTAAQPALGLVLRDRSLRFAVLDGSSLFAADLTGADLRKATLLGARLPGARLNRTQVQEADLTDAELQGVDSIGALLDHSHLRNGHLKGQISVRRSFKVRTSRQRSFRVQTLQARTFGVRS
jgi:Pentapeptide repeats (8 copies)